MQVGYADKKHVKEIKLTLYINNEIIDSISGSKTMNLGNQYMFKVNRSKFPPNTTHVIKIEAKGYLHTEFIVDGLMQDQTKREIKLKVLPKKVIPINSQNVKVLSKISEKLVVSPLAQTTNTNKAGSIGFIEAGKYLVLKYNLNIPKSGMEDIKILLDDKIIQPEIKYNANINDKPKEYVVFIKIPEETESSLYGWYSLRELTKSYFEVENSNILERRRTPHVLKLAFVYNEIKYDNEIKFDTLDNYLLNINNVINNRILNFFEINKYEDLERWI